MDARFNTLYSAIGRASIPPEYLLRATLLEAFFSVRSERMLIGQINYAAELRFIYRVISMAKVVAMIT